MYTIIFHYFSRKMFSQIVLLEKKLNYSVREYFEINPYQI